MIDGERLDDEADRSTLGRRPPEAGGEGGMKLGGGAFNPEILPSEINFLKLLKSSLVSFSSIGGGGGGGGMTISFSSLALLFLRSGLAAAVDLSLCKKIKKIND